MVQALTIDIAKLSKQAQRKLMKGGAIRVSPPNEKGSMKMPLHPEVAKRIMRAFNKGKGATLSGEGIFGEWGDDLMDLAGKELGVKNLRKSLYKVGDLVKKPVSKAAQTGILSGAAALGVYQPYLAPYLAAGAPVLARAAGRYIEDPKDYGVYAKGYRGKRQNPLIAGIKTIAGEELKNYLGEQLKGAMGENSIPTPANLAPSSVGEGMVGRFGAGRRRMVGGRIMGYEKSSIGNSLLNAPALMSQPFSTNFQFGHTLPPALQGNRGTGLY
jgi:hypothetical protein